MTRAKSRTASCSKEDARSRFKRAESFLIVADLVLGERVETYEQEDGIERPPWRPSARLGAYWSWAAVR